MKPTLIRLFLLPSNLVGIVSLCLLGLILSYAPLPEANPSAQGDPDEFLYQRRGVTPTDLLIRVVWLNEARFQWVGPKIGKISP